MLYLSTILLNDILFRGQINEHSMSTLFKYSGHYKDETELVKMSVDEILNRIVFSLEARSICRSLIYATCGTLNKKILILPPNFVLTIFLSITPT